MSFYSNDPWRIHDPEEIQQGTMHGTNKAFDRYFQKETQDAKKVYQAAQNLKRPLSGSVDSGKTGPILSDNEYGMHRWLNHI